MGFDKILLDFVILWPSQQFLSVEMDSVICEIQFFLLEFPCVKSFLRVPEMRLQYPFVSNPLIFPSAFVHKPVSFAMAFLSLLHDFFNFVFFWILSKGL